MKYWIVIILLISIIFPSTVLAISDEFTINALIGSDTFSPTAPTSLVATSTGSDSVSLNWGASSDNVAVAGYNIWRDNLLIATTTITTYLDLGLIASTSYDYYVTAFDSSGNVSASSSIASVITDSAVETPVPTQSSSEATKTVKLVEVSNLVTTVTENSILITFNTSVPVGLRTSWGQTASYELGYSSSIVFSTNHKIIVNGLSAGTKYHLQIIGQGRFKEQTFTENISVSTKEGADIVTPPNVQNLRSVYQDGDIHLTWINPKVNDFSYVRVVRSEGFFPLDEADGAVVYEGTNEKWTDFDVQADRGRYFYTVFSYDQAGNRSSGATTLVKWGRQEVDEEKPPLNQLPESIIKTVEFSQGDLVQYATSTGSVRVVGDQHLTISIPYSSLPEHLKTVLVTLTEESTGYDYSFILRINNDGTAYEAVLDSFTQPGDYKYSIFLYDYTASATSEISGNLSVYVEDSSSHENSSPTWKSLYSGVFSLLISLALLILLRRFFKPKL